MSTLPPISSLLSQPQFDLPNFKANFNKALTSISVPRLFAAVTTKAEAPNPLLHVYNGKSDIGLPISPEQTELLRGRGILRRDARMGVDMIRMEELAIRNLAWKIWAQDQGKALVAEKFGIADVMVYFEFAFVSDGQAGDWGKEFWPKKEEAGFGKFLVILPGSKAPRLTISSPHSTDVCVNPHNTKEGNLTLATWYHGAKPVLKSKGDLCLLYHFNLRAPHPYLPAQLSLPVKISGEPLLRKCLQDWLSSVRCGTQQDKQGPKFLTWILDNEFDKFENMSGIDRERADMLLAVAKDSGFRVHFASFEWAETGSADGWRRREYYDSEYEDYEPYSGWREVRGLDRTPEDTAEIDAQGNHWFIDCDEDAGVLRLHSWKDLLQNQSLPETLELNKLGEERKKLLMLPERDWIESKGAPGTIPSEDYDSECGGLVWTWRRASLVIWPEDFHFQNMVDIFGWKVARLIKEPLYFPGDNGISDRTKIVEALLARPGRVEVKNANMFEFEACGRDFLNFTMEIGRSDLFLSTLEKCGLPRTHYTLKPAFEKFTSDEFRSRIVAMWTDRIPRFTEKLHIVAYFYGKGSEEIAKFIQQNYREDSFADELQPLQLCSLPFVIGNEIFRHEVLPKLESYHATELWLSLLGIFQGDCKLLKERLPRLVEHHVAGFNIPRAAAASSSGATRASDSLYASAWRGGSTHLLLRRILESSLHYLIPAMLQKILSISPPQFKKPEDQLTFYIAILTVIKNELSAKISAESLSAIPHFFQVYILQNIFPALGARPPPARTDYAIPPLPCFGNVNCGRHCRPVSDFLRSSTENMKTWTMSVADRKHIMNSINTSYSHNHHLLVSEGKPPMKGRSGSLILRKSGLSSSERCLEWESRRETVERALGSFSEFFVKGEWRDIIFVTAMKGGPGFTALIQNAAAEWLRKPFPEPKDEEMMTADPTVDAAAAAVTLEGSPELIPPEARPAFLGYAHIDPWGISFDHPRLQDEDLEMQYGPIKDSHGDLSQTLLARRDPRNAIRVSTNREKLQRRVIYMPVKEFANAAEVPWYWGISSPGMDDPSFQVFEYQGESKVTELRTYLHKQKTTRDWWIAEIYDSRILDGIRGVYEKLAEWVPQVPVPAMPAPAAPNTESLPQEPLSAMAVPADRNLEARMQSGRKRGMSESGDAPAAPVEAPKKQKRAVEIIDLDSDDEE